MLRKTLLGLIFFTASSLHAEPILYDISGHQKESIFTTYLKVDVSDINGHNISDDMFLKYDTNKSLVSENVNFNDVDSFLFNYTFEDTFDWSITREQNRVEFKVGDYTLSQAAIEGEWDALSFSLFNGFYAFDRASISVDIKTWNGNELSNPIGYSSSLGYAANFILADSEQSEIANIEGTIAFDGELGWWSSLFGRKSGGKMSSMWTAYDLDDFGYADEFEFDFGNNDGNLKDVNAPTVLAAFVAFLILIGRKKRS